MAGRIPAATVAEYIDLQGRYFWFFSFNGEITCHEGLKRVRCLGVYDSRTRHMLERIQAWLQFELRTKYRKGA